jgi:hypothetical protein
MFTVQYEMNLVHVILSVYKANNAILFQRKEF